jgi:hypothetical protein
MKQATIMAGIFAWCLFWLGVNLLTYTDSFQEAIR